MLRLVLSLLVAVPASAADFGPLTPLVGACWRATLADEKTTDEHCYEAMLGGAYVRDRHTLTGAEGLSVTSETVFEPPSPSGEVRYTAWSEVGRISNGAATVVDGALRFPEETRDVKGDRPRIVRAVLRIVDGDRYEVVTEKKQGTDWTPDETVGFARVAEAAP